MNSTTLMFENIAKESRIWIYQCNLSLDDNKQVEIKQRLSEHLLTWKAHDNPLRAGSAIFYDRFVVIALDEKVNSASGCSIDATTKWLKTIGGDLGVDFFDRCLVYFKDEQLFSVSLNDVKKSIEAGEILKDTIIFNNNIQRLSQLDTDWKIPAIDSWLKRYFE
ncbi:MAG: hypothetical protein KA313_04760 [Pseudarcicella sp.]|nr:hypothetical protein [Pseudarcicella sp.]